MRSVILNPKLFLALMLPLFAACAGHKPVAQRADAQEELDAIRARANAAMQEVDRQDEITR
ncbi:MAG: hypothetical protein A2234_06420 [Elusimicrobia bacterium RIFOXYA2_FULL_58_8]|nr:MAG: hypothetical protein A2285_03165 [Elusimicrobia bacterium RIFOXYA12_FULL_57_11]OGS17433.1 MAG: hypothetical protein A2234_06420 [Elusimicrobia bacterium RIFOXYA2_FULL_58_8]